MKNKFTNLCLISVLVLYGAMPLLASPPDWVVQEHNYAHNANIIADLQVNGNINEELDNIIGFFVGEELRGLAQPITIGGDPIYFITVYSNVSAGEIDEMSMRVYIAADDAIYTSPDTYTFRKGTLLGNLDNPHIIRIYSDGDFPIAIDDIPEQNTLQGNAFMTIDLNDYLLREDNDFINWAYQVNPDLEVSLSGSMLSVTATDPTWIGSTFLDLTATEVTSNQYSATKRVVFTSKEFFVSPLWDGLPNATVELGDLFPAFNLNEYEHSYDGNCLNFSVQPVLSIPDEWSSRPDWEVTPQNFQYTMTTIHKVQFSDYYTFSGTGDLLAAFVNGEVRGVATPRQTPRGEWFFFITTYSNDQEEMTFKFYSETYREIHEIIEPIMFQTNFSNPVEEPIVLDVAPIKVQILEFGGAIIYVCDDTWTGSQAFEYTVEDCENPEIRDMIEVVYTVSGEALAVDLLHFSGALNSQDAVALQWEITPNPDLKVFEIEHTTMDDFDKNWTKIGEVENSEVSTRHSYVDYKPISSMNYYRLKMIEKSGAFSYSNTIAIDGKDEISFSIFPNPVVQQEIQLNWSENLEENASVDIYDAKANLMFQQKNINRNEQLSLPELAAGLYIIHLKVDGHSYLKKVIVP